MIDPDGALNLAGAIARQWLKDRPDEYVLVALWLGLDPRQLRPARPAGGDGVTTCRTCGARLPEQTRGGRRRVFCSKSCAGRA